MSLWVATLGAAATPLSLNYTIGVGVTVDVPNNDSLTLLATGLGTLTNNGSLTLSSAGNHTNLILSGGPITFAGTGAVTLSANANNRIYGTTGTETLVNAAGHTFQGSGQLGVNLLAVVNQGLIVANQAVALSIDPNATGFTNTGTLRATGGATLELVNGSFANTGGLIEAHAGSVVSLHNASVSGGTLTSAGTGRIQALGTAQLAQVAISSGTSVEVGNNQRLELSGTIQNAGTFRLLSQGNFTDLVIAADHTTLLGGGTIELGDNANNRLYGASATFTLVNQAGTIRGSGQLGVGLLGLTNLGLVVANQPTALILSPSSLGVSNSGTLRAQSGGTLRLLAGTYTNSSTGTIEATGTGSAVEFSGSTVVGGRLIGTTGGQLRTVASSTFTDIALAAGSTLDVINNTLARFTGTLVNQGLLTLSSAGNFTDFVVAGGDLQLQGSGTIALGNNANNRLYGESSTLRLINAGSTIQGSGQLGVDLLGIVNQGTIRAHQPVPLVIDPSASGVTNTGVLRAEAGATLELRDGTFANTGGRIEATGAGALVDFAAATISGGRLIASGGGLLRNVAATTYSNFTLEGTLRILNNTSATFSGTLANLGTLELRSSGNHTDLIVAPGGWTMTGGVLDLGDNANSRVYGIVGGGDQFSFTIPTFVNDAGQVRGMGQLGVDLLRIENRGTIEANRAGGSLIVDPGASGFVNAGQLTASNGGILVLRDGSFDNWDGLISPGAGSRVELDRALVQGGLLAGTTLRHVGGSTLQDVAIEPTLTVEVVNNTALTLLGEISNAGTLRLQSTGNHTDLVIGSAGVVLSGGGTIALGSSGADRIYGADTAAVLDNSNQTIQGTGQLGLNLLVLRNSGTIAADRSGTLLVDLANPTPFENHGTLRASDGGQLRFVDPLRNAAYLEVGAGSSFVAQSTFAQSSGATTLLGGSFSAASATFDTGLLQGNGTLSGAIANGGVIAPGADGAEGIGTLVFTQGLTLASTSILLLELSGSSHDRIEAQSIALNGFLAVSFGGEQRSGFLSTDTFTLLSTTQASGITGTFIGLADGSRLFTTDGLGSFRINYSGNSVTLSDFQAIPEPSTYVLLALGAAALWRLQRRRV